MKNLKLRKFIVVLCIGSMAASITGCGKTEKASEQTEKVTETVEETSAEVTEEAQKEVEEEVIEPEEPENTEEVEENKESEEEPEEVDIEAVLGINSEHSYENSYFGIAVALDDEWDLETQEEIEETRKNTMNLAGNDEMVEDAMSVTVTDMMAVHSNGYDTINFGIERPDWSDYTEEDYVEAATDPTIETLSLMGMEDISADTGTVHIGDDVHAAFKILGTYNGSDVYELLVAFKEGDYVGVMTVCTWDDDLTDDIINYVNKY